MSTRRKTRRNPVRYPGDQDPTNLLFARSREFIARAIRNLRASDRQVVEKLINNPLIDAVRTRIDETDGGEYVIIIIRSGLWMFCWIALFREYGRDGYSPVDSMFYVRKFESDASAWYPTAAEARDRFLSNVLQG